MAAISNYEKQWGVKYRLILGHVRLTNHNGVVMKSEAFTSLYHRLRITKILTTRHYNKLITGEWHLSYLLD